MTSPETASQLQTANTALPSINNTTASRDFDIVLYGATSFVGQLVLAYLLKQLKASDDQGLCDPQTKQPIRLAIAGRSEDKLTELKQRLQATTLPIIIANSDDEQSLQTMTSQTRLIISTVGPYLKYGEPLIKACVTQGTHYVDLCGEAIWIKFMIDKYADVAAKTGAKIVNSCGFDSLPSDLGVWYTQQQAYKQYQMPAETIHMRVKKLKGGLSGGTFSSMIGIYELMGHDKQLRKKIANPYLLNTDDNSPKIRQPAIFKPTYSVTENRWLAPFVMSSINTRIVHRSNYLLDYAYGRYFVYEETMTMPNTTKGKFNSFAMTGGLLGFSLAASFKLTRQLLVDKLLPKSGEGPSKTAQENGLFIIDFIATNKNGHQLTTEVTGDKDPGYAGTAKMLSQAALCLLQDTDTLVGGFWTPAAAMAEPLIARLQQYAGIKFSVIAQ